MECKTITDIPLANPNYLRLRSLVPNNVNTGNAIEIWVSKINGIQWAFNALAL